MITKPSTQTAPTVLVVDDECDARDSLKDLLEGAGYEVACARNGDEALAYLRRHPRPVAVLLDLFMPVMNGWQFVRAVRAIPEMESLPIVLVTGQAPHWGYPVKHVVKKPVDADHLLVTLKTVVDSRGIAA